MVWISEFRLYHQIRKKNESEIWVRKLRSCDRRIFEKFRNPNFLESIGIKFESNQYSESKKYFLTPSSRLNGRISIDIYSAL